MFFRKYHFIMSLDLREFIYIFYDTIKFEKLHQLKRLIFDCSCFTVIKKELLDGSDKATFPCSYIYKGTFFSLVFYCIAKKKTSSNRRNSF